MSRDAAKAGDGADAQSDERDDDVMVCREPASGNTLEPPCPRLKKGEIVIVTNLERRLDLAWRVFQVEATAANMHDRVVAKLLHPVGGDSDAPMSFAPRNLCRMNNASGGIRIGQLGIATLVKNLPCTIEDMKAVKRYCGVEYEDNGDLLRHGF